MDKKMCLGCSQEKPRDGFYEEKRNKDGMTKLCRCCLAEYNKDRRKQGKGQYYKKIKEPKLKVGEKHGKLTIVEVLKVPGTAKEPRTEYRCICDCGGTYHLPAAWYLKNVSSCGCLRRKENNKKWSGFRGISGSVFCRAKTAARKRDLPFSLTIEYLDQLKETQEGKCALTGIQLEFGEGLRKRKVELTASLDRIDGTAGYTEGNVQWVHKDVNLMKNKFGEEYFKQMCWLVTRHEAKKVGK